MKLKDQKIRHWVIEIVSWGTLLARGTEEQAEDWRKHKAKWEGCIGRKREATPKEIEDGEFENLSALL